MVSGSFKAANIFPGREEHHMVQLAYFPP